MRIRFTKMQGAGNDFVVLDETAGPLGLTAAQYRWLADRHFGVGADQILAVRAAPTPEVDFEYVIHNADGGRVEQCGNGARCFVRYVRDHGLSQKDRLRVQVAGRTIELLIEPDGRVRVDMGAPVFDLPRVPFHAAAATPVAAPHGWPLWRLVPAADFKSNQPEALVHALSGAIVDVAVLSMGNPHAVWRVDDVDRAPVASLGPWIESHPAFPQRVNAGFMQVIDRRHIRLRVYERGAGETLACGTGACAAVVAGIRQGWLDPQVDVDTRGGRLSIAWAGGAHDPVYMTGPATRVFEGELDLPAQPEAPA